MINIKSGDVIRKVYPYSFYESTEEEGFFGRSEWWQIGCKKTFEQYGQGYGETFYHADGEGFIDIEILAVVDMPRQIKKRVLYKFDQILPDGKIKKSSRVYTVTIDKFKELITGNAYWYEYELIED
jgi:hypothetical protein